MRDWRRKLAVLWKRFRLQILQIFRHFFVSMKFDCNTTIAYNRFSQRVAYLKTVWNQSEDLLWHSSVLCLKIRWRLASEDSLIKIRLKPALLQNSIWRTLTKFVLKPASIIIIHEISETTQVSSFIFAINYCQFAVLYDITRSIFVLVNQMKTLPRKSFLQFFKFLRSGAVQTFLSNYLAFLLNRFKHWRRRWNLWQKEAEK